MSEEKLVETLREVTADIKLAPSLSTVEHSAETPDDSHREPGAGRKFQPLETAPGSRWSFLRPISGPAGISGLAVGHTMVSSFTGCRSKLTHKRRSPYYWEQLPEQYCPQLPLHRHFSLYRALLAIMCYTAQEL